MSMPILFAANAPAVFELADSLDKSNREYLTFHDLDHNEFISQGMFRRKVETWLKEGKASREAVAAPDSSADSFKALCEYILAFLDGTLMHDAPRKEALDAKYNHVPLGGELPHVEHVPAGLAFATPYRDSDANPPAPDRCDCS